MNLNIYEISKAIEEELRKERLREKEAEENITCDFDTEEENDDDYESWKLRELRRIKRDREEKESYVLQCLTYKY